jgi:hypothetical protein
MAFQSLIDILKKANQSYPLFSRRLEEAEALGRWQIAVGELIARHSRAIRVKDSILWVEVDHPIWKSELHYRKHQILQILNGQIQREHSSAFKPADKPSGNHSQKNSQKMSLISSPSNARSAQTDRETLLDIVYIDRQLSFHSPYRSRKTNQPNTKAPTSTIQKRE